MSLIALFVCGYLFVLAVASLRRPAQAGASGVRFDVIVPAHDEESGIARTVASLLAADYPAALRRVIVVADNCSDATAERAAAAGARVLVRNDPGHRGKGHALSFGFARCLEEGFAQAILVVDADTLVSPNLLSAFAARVQMGALALQARGAVANAADSWRTQLMQLGLSLFNGVRSLARENLGLSAGLRGNGMCLAASLLRRHPWNAFSLVEDVEYGIAIGRAGVRVGYVDEAEVRSDIAAGASAARSQRRRWELGRLALARRLALPLLDEALRRHSPMLLDLALDLIVPPLSLIALLVVAGLWLSHLGAAWIACALMLAVYVARGWALSGTGASGLKALLRAPLYVAWKIAALAGGGPSGWVRTPREDPAA